MVIDTQNKSLHKSILKVKIVGKPISLILSLSYIKMTISFSNYEAQFHFENQICWLTNHLHIV
jgi:hypothetical protein